ncbi:hypothetical protein BD560DRAFT_486980 [Blakeslea trispora]|nr:hypothetical protein BD560DRAFT_486980 [Blakeslea trispora]
MIHWGHGKHFICPVHSSDRRVPTNSGPAVDLQWDFTITFVQRTPNCCTNNRRPPLNLAAVDVLLGVVLVSKGFKIFNLLFGSAINVGVVTYWGDIKLSDLIRGVIVQSTTKSYTGYSGLSPSRLQRGNVSDLIRDVIVSDSTVPIQLKSRDLVLTSTEV